nr:hypothetical protein CFP56_72918 [Quercus suber]
MPLLFNIIVVEDAAEIGLKGVRKIVSVCDKSLTAGAAEIGSSMLGLDGIEIVENVKQILSKVQKLEGKMDAGFQRMDHKIEEKYRKLELLIKSRCEGVMPFLPNLTVAKGVAEMGLKGIGKLVSVRDKSIKDGAAEIGKSMLSLDSIELMGSVKKILTKTISTKELLLKLKHKMDNKFQIIEQKMDNEFKIMELLIKSTCGGGPKQLSSSSSGNSGSDGDLSFDNGFDSGD